MKGKAQLSASLSASSVSFPNALPQLAFSLLKFHINYDWNLPSNIPFCLEDAGCCTSHTMLSQAAPHLLATTTIIFFLYPKDSVLRLMLCDKSALIRSQLIYVSSTSKWFNTSSNDLYISDFLMPEKAPAEVYGSRTIKSSTEQYIIAGDYMLETTDLRRTR